MNHYGVIGCGAWALTIANILNENKHKTTVWCHEQSLATTINQQNKHPQIPNLPLHKNIHATHDLTDCLTNKTGIIFGIASPFIDIINSFPENHTTPTLILTKGLLENKNTLFIYEYIQEKQQHCPLAILSGPNLAQEISEKKPAATVIASHNEACAQHFQDALSNTYFRAYTATDVKGVALGGILKNIMAIAGGCIDGLELGMNTKSALLARSLQEMIRIGCFLGGEKESFFGLSGLGDLITTANSSLSRNWNVGNALAKGINFKEQLKKTGSVAEGIKTTKIIHELSKKHHLSMPITEQIYLTLFENKDPKEAIQSLMKRKLKPES